jgi:hypothetical protein
VLGWVTRADEVDAGEVRVEEVRAESIAPARSASRRFTILRSAPLKSAFPKSSATQGFQFRHSLQAVVPCRNTLDVLVDRRLTLPRSADISLRPAPRAACQSSSRLLMVTPYRDMHLDLSDEETAALIKEFYNIARNDRYPSPSGDPCPEGDPREAQAGAGRERLPPP